MTLVRVRACVRSLFRSVAAAHASFPPRTDFGVVLGADAHGGGGGSGTSVLVIAVPVAVAVGSLVVVAVASACVTAAWIRRRRLARQVGHTVSFDASVGDPSDASDPDIL